MKAIINIDVVSNATGEVLEQFKEIWLGDKKNILEDISKRYVIDRVEKEGDFRTVWVQE